MTWCKRRPWYKRLVGVRHLVNLLTPKRKIPNFKSIRIPMIKKVSAELLAEQLVGVQPMTGPTGLAYSLRFSTPTRFKKFCNWIYN